MGVENQRPAVEIGGAILCRREDERENEAYGHDPGD